MKRLFTTFALAASLLAGHAGADCILGRMAELPVTMTDLRPLVHARINGVDERFIADRGAFWSFITPATAAELGLRLTPAPFNMRVGGVGGEADVSLATVKQFEIAASKVANVQFLVGGSEMGEESAGVLGQNLLGIADVEYDLANGVIRLMKPHGCGDQPLVYWLKTATYSSMPIGETTPLSPHTTGTASVNGVKISVMFDTGAATSYLSLAAAKRAGIGLDMPGVTPSSLFSGIGRKMVQTWIAPVDSFVVGGEEIRHTRLRIGAAGIGDRDMVLGADFFLSHHVYVAKSQRRLYFTYNGGPVFNLNTTPQDQGDAGAGSPAAPADAEGFSRRGAAFAARRDFDHAIADFTRASELAPGEGRYLYQRAVARLDNKQPVLAMGDVSQALRLKPDDVDSLTMRAQLRLAAPDVKEAIVDLDAVSRLVPKEADRRLALAELYLRAEQFPSAVNQFDLWIKAHPDDSHRSAALGGRGLVHLRLGETDKALADFDAALTARPKFPWALYGRGVVRLRKGMTAAGKADIAAASALQPSLPEEARRRGIAP